MEWGGDSNLPASTKARKPDSDTLLTYELCTLCWLYGAYWQPKQSTRRFKYSWADENGPLWKVMLVAIRRLPVLLLSERWKSQEPSFTGYMHGGRRYLNLKNSRPTVSNDGVTRSSYTISPKSLNFVLGVQDHRAQILLCRRVHKLCFFLWKGCSISLTNTYPTVKQDESYSYSIALICILSA